MRRKRKMAIKYIPYYPETIEGQAILNNFTRTQRFLKYKDSNGLETSIAKGMPLYEMESIEKVGISDKTQKFAVMVFSCGLRKANMLV